MSTSPTNDPADIDEMRDDAQGHVYRHADEQIAEGEDDVEGHIYVQEPGAPGSRER